MAGSHQTYTTHLEELGGGALGRGLHRQKMTMAPRGVPLLGWMCRWALRQPSSAGPSGPAALPPPTAGLPNSPDASRALLLLI